MLNEWSDRDPEPPSRWRDWMLIGFALIIGAVLMINIGQRIGLI